MEVSNSDCPEHWKTLCVSLLWRSKPTLWRTWLQRLKKVSWLSKLCTRTLNPSQRIAFLGALTSSLRATRASRSVVPASEKEPKTLDTFGRILRESCRQLDLFGASLKTSPDTLPSDSPKFIAAYEIWVTQLRRDYSGRLKWAQTIYGRDSTYLPTPTVKGNHNYRGASKKAGDGLVTVLKREYLPTPCASDTRGANDYQTTLAKLDRGHRDQQGQLINRLMILLNGERGRLNPSFVEKMMGVPEDWTDCDYVETESSPLKQPKHLGD